MPRAQSPAPRALLLAVAALAPAAGAQEVQIEVFGSVEYNQIASGALGAADPGDPVVVRLRVDASVFVDDAQFPTRGYPILPGTFALEAGSASVGLQSPLPPGLPPMFVVRDDDPAVDGFFLSRETAGPTGLPLAQNGVFGPFVAAFSVTYGDDPLSGLDLLPAAGTYDFAGLTVFHLGVEDGPFNPLGVLFEKLVITPLAPPSCGYATYGAASPAGSALGLQGVGSPAVGGPFRVLVPGAPPSGAFVALSTAAAELPLFGGTALVAPGGLFALHAAPSGPSGAGLVLAIPPDPAFAGLEVFAQAAALDALAPEGLALSNGLHATVCP